ncbi:MAG: hypothetical protein AB7O96_12930 [Pseudobdellovibrionaceae bacterium]
MIMNNRGNISWALALGAASFILFTGVMRYVFTADAQVNEMMIKRSILNLRNSTLATLGDQAAWAATMQRNPNMNCLVHHTCRDGTTVPGKKPTLTLNSKFSTVDLAGLKRQVEANLGPSSNTPPVVSKFSDIALYKSDGTLVSDSQNPSAGFRFDGTACTGFTPSGNDRCPLRMNVQWKPSCENAVHPGNCQNPEEVVSLTFVYAPRSAQYKFPLNPANYNYTSERLYLGTNVPLMRCAQVDAVYIGNFGGGVTSLNGISTDAAGCAHYAALQGPPGPQGPMGPAASSAPPPPPPPPGPILIWVNFLGSCPAGVTCTMGGGCSGVNPGIVGGCGLVDAVTIFPNYPTDPVQAAGLAAQVNLGYAGTNPAPPPPMHAGPPGSCLPQYAGACLVPGEGPQFCNGLNAGNCVPH